VSAIQADYEARRQAGAQAGSPRSGQATATKQRRPPAEHELGSLGGPIVRAGPLRIELLTARGSPPPVPEWVPRGVVDDATSGRLPPGAHLLPYVWPSGFERALIVDVGTRSPVLGQSIRFYRLYPDDLRFWALYTHGDEKAAKTLQQHWHTRNRDMWHYVKDLHYPPEYAEAELHYIDDQVFKALVGAFATVLGAGATVGQVGAGVARAGAPRAAGRLEPGEQAWSMQRQYGKQLREFGESVEQELAQARSAAQAGKSSGGGGGAVVLGETLQAAPGGRVGTATTPVPVPGTGQAAPAPSLAERGGCPLRSRCPASASPCREQAACPPRRWRRGSPGPHRPRPGR
jgi:hypothetical protein